MKSCVTKLTNMVSWTSKKWMFPRLNPVPSTDPSKSTLYPTATSTVPEDIEVDSVADSCPSIVSFACASMTPPRTETP